MSVSLLKWAIKARIMANKELKDEIQQYRQLLVLGKKELRRLKYSLNKSKIGGSK